MLVVGIFLFVLIYIVIGYNIYRFIDEFIDNDPGNPYKKCAGFVWPVTSIMLFIRLLNIIIYKIMKFLK